MAREYGEYRSTDTFRLRICDKGGACGEQAAHTVSQSKNNAGLLHGSLDLKTVLDRGSHRLLAQNIVSLRSERLDHLCMHVVLDGNDNGVRETLSDRPDALCGSIVELLPGFEHETAIDAVLICEARARLGPWLRDGYHPALRGL